MLCIIPRSVKTDVYKRQRHGGANLKVMEMFENIEENVTNWEDENELRTYLTKMLDREAFDGTGLVYGMGHAVYTPVSYTHLDVYKRQALYSSSFISSREIPLSMQYRTRRPTMPCASRNGTPFPTR